MDWGAGKASWDNPTNAETRNKFAYVHVMPNIDYEKQNWDNKHTIDVLFDKILAGERSLNEWPRAKDYDGKFYGQVEYDAEMDAEFPKFFGFKRSDL